MKKIISTLSLLFIGFLFLGSCNAKPIDANGIQVDSQTSNEREVYAYLFMSNTGYYFTLYTDGRELQKATMLENGNILLNEKEYVKNSESTWVYWEKKQLGYEMMNSIVLISTIYKDNNYPTKG